MKKNKKHSVVRQMSIALCTVYIFMVALMLINTTHTLGTSRERIYSEISGSLKVSNNQIQSDLSSAEKYLTSLALSTSSSNLKIIERNRGDTEFYRAINNQKLELEKTLASVGMIEGLFIFPTSNRLLIAYARNPVSPTIHRLRSVMRLSMDADTLKDFPGKSWFPIYLDNQYYLLRVFRIGESYVGAWVSFTAMLSLVESNQALAETSLFTFGNHAAYDIHSQKSGLRPDAANSTEDYTLFDSEETYLSIAIEAGYTQNGYIALLVPDKLITEELMDNYMLAALSIGFYIVLAPIILWILRAFLQRPVGKLKHSIDALREGDFGVRITPDETYDEFKAVNSAFNDMVERIQSLKISIYEEKLKWQDMQMRFLKSQVAPHFLINCLNAIYHMNSTGKTKEISGMTISLGEHLRYTLADHETVPLSLEAEQTKNYVELSKLRFPGSIDYYADIDPELENAVVMPMQILTFVENTIKYQTVAGEVTEIYVTVSSMNKGDTPTIHLCVWDTGDGWPPDILQRLQNKDMMTNDTGHHIGIRNIYYRMEYMYKKDFDMHFSNRKDAGAQIDIIFPYIEYSALHLTERNYPHEHTDRG